MYSTRCLPFLVFSPSCRCRSTISLRVYLKLSTSQNVRRERKFDCVTKLKSKRKSARKRCENSSFVSLQHRLEQRGTNLQPSLLPPRFVSSSPPRPPFSPRSCSRECGSVSLVSSPECTLVCRVRLARWGVSHQSPELSVGLFVSRGTSSLFTCTLYVIGLSP